MYSPFSMVTSVAKPHRVNVTPNGRNGVSISVRVGSILSNSNVRGEPRQHRKTPQKYKGPEASFSCLSSGAPPKIPKYTCHREDISPVVPKHVTLLLIREPVGHYITALITALYRYVYKRSNTLPIRNAAILAFRASRFSSLWLKLSERDVC